MLTGRRRSVFCGRKDNQIKYRGHRIELEEIDKAFEGFSDVDRCRCAFDSKKNRLCAFYEGTACEKELPGRGGIIASRFHEADAHREGAEHAAEQEREGGPCDAPGIARRTGEAREG